MILRNGGVIVATLYLDDLAGSNNEETFTLSSNDPFDSVEIVSDSGGNFDILNFEADIVTTGYEYLVNINAGLTDTTETLSAATLSNIPVDVIVRDSNGVDIAQNADGTYSVDLDANGDATVSIISSSELTSTQTEAITTSVSSIEPTGDTAATVIGGSGDDSIVFDIGDSYDTIILNADINLDFNTGL
ncbi:MAG: hypothetical protein FAF04_03970 [Epsilonproteobacteria bacterium]|nr:hypothetical protein [Campylobacterota bacterium]